MAIRTEKTRGEPLTVSMAWAARRTSGALLPGSVAHLPFSTHACCRHAQVCGNSARCMWASGCPMEGLHNLCAKPFCRGLWCY